MDSNRLSILFSLLLLPVAMYSQVKITGKIADQDNKPQEYAEVLLLTAKGVALTSGLSDQTGFFDLTEKTGDYQLQVKILGNIVYSRELTANQNIDLGTIKVETSQMLHEITVASKKKLIERKVDRLVFNVENSVSAKGMDLVQALSQTPLVRVDDYGVSIVGKSNVTVMVNDRILNISGVDLINYLKSLRSDDVSKIEIITTPPAKYEAQGNSGLINIVLKRNPKLGWSGNYSTSLAQNTYASFTNNLGLNYQSEKLSTSLRVRQFDRSSKATEQIDVIGANSILSHDTRKDLFNGYGANLNVDYKITSKANIGFIYDIGRLDNDMNIRNTSVYQTGAAIDSILSTYSEHRNPVLTQTLNAFYEVKLDTVGKKLTLAGNFFSNLPETTVDFATTSSETFLTDRVQNISEIDYTIVSGQADAHLPYQWATVETGAKYTQFKNDSEVQYLNFIAPAYSIDAARSNLFDYEEGNVAAYVSASKDFAKKWSAMLGLRYEYSTIEGFSETSNQNTSYDYDNWFPTGYLTYKANDSHTFSINYSKRINRPNFRALNPFRWYSNPFTYYTGNPLLKPSFNHNVEFSYLYKDLLSVAVYAQKMVDGYGRTVDFVNGIKEVNYRNYLTQHDFGVNANLYLTPYKWWENYINVVSYYSESKSALAYVLPQEGFSFYYSTNNTFTLHKEKAVFFLLNFWHSLPSKQGNTYSENLSALSGGFRFPILGKKLQVNLMAEDILKGSVSKGEIYFSGYTQQYNNYYDNRRVTLSLSYRFGNKQVRGSGKQIEFTEKERSN